ncbi:AraC family transcriptional regulator [Dasania sp. GY-MA-18]|uniref:AraC family transcriptional regulator n=1 Tax=Dasania phycosphaerae TaxID=2950436 RepID=A0A9J6RKT2_9GAMM|nr:MULTISPECIES: AraC family transcriptional regulator [Dasania]MCR8922371.1 AraC family transcriptional regulator [Dasania sp. GY-MA-18]MCZ0864799.1 AraC family transcriptional regulator [Dasania phycosphaerae]MCZ0868527.1 AraC family transcriptional regulator [Dasania phycosphaerae]
MFNVLFGKTASKASACWLFSFILFAAGSASAQPEQALVDDVQSIKEQVLELNKDLFILEEELLFPAETQLSVYVSLDVGQYFKLDAVKLMVDGEMVSSYLYTDSQVDALRRGAIQRLYQGNVRSGEHEVVAVFTGFGPQGENFRRATDITFTKDSDAKHLELKIIDSTALQQPEFVVKEW